MQVNKYEVILPAKIVLETELDFAIMKALIEKADLNLDDTVTTELFKITGIDERRNVEHWRVNKFLRELKISLNAILLETKSIRREME